MLENLLDLLKLLSIVVSLIELLIVVIEELLLYERIKDRNNELILRIY